MSCEQVKELLSGYLDNVLATEEQQRVAAHLETCSECSALLTDFRRFDALLSQLPRISPDPALRERIFSSPAYLELTGTDGRTSDQTVAHRRVGGERQQRPHLVSLPGGRQASSHNAPSSQNESSAVLSPSEQRRPRRSLGMTIMRASIAAALLLTVGVGGLIGWNLFHKSGTEQQAGGGITPPADLRQSPIPAGTHFIFARNGVLWSGSVDGTTGVLRLTPEHVTTSSNWAIRPAQPGHVAGNLLAYIDIQQGYVHIIRSDGQRDTILSQPLLKSNMQPTTVWDTETGTAILSSLTWSHDGSMLAFVADPHGTGKTSLYIATTTGSIQQVTLPVAGAVSHPVWSPDDARIAFKFAHDNTVGILDYNVQNHGVLTIVPNVRSATYPGDTIVDLNWSPLKEIPQLTWSVGTAGHVHSLWQQRVGVTSNVEPRQLAQGDYTQATYQATKEKGEWLVINTRTAPTGDLESIDLAGTSVPLVNGKQMSNALCSPDGNFVTYLENAASGRGALHLVNVTTGADTLLSSTVVADPAPVWSADSQYLAYSTGSQVLYSNVQTGKTAQTLKLHGPATALGWTPASPNQLVVAMGEGQQGLYLIDIDHETSLQLDKEGTRGPLFWLQVP